MKGIAAILPVLALLAGPAHSAGLAADADASAELEIKSLELHLADLLMRREWDTYATFLADDYTRITDTGEVQSREEVLRGFKGGTGRGAGRMEPSDLNVKVYGDTAILTGLLKVTRPETPQARVSRFRKVFIRRDGRWYLVSLQGARYAP